MWQKWVFCTQTQTWWVAAAPFVESPLEAFMVSDPTPQVQVKFQKQQSEAWWTCHFQNSETLKHSLECKIWKTYNNLNHLFAYIVSSTVNMWQHLQQRTTLSFPAEFGEVTSQAHALTSQLSQAEDSSAWQNIQTSLQRQNANIEELKAFKPFNSTHGFWEFRALSASGQNANFGLCQTTRWT